jgi:hypothetical protein
MVENPFWSEIRKILGARIQEVVRDASGPRDKFYRMIRPEAFFTVGTADKEATQMKQAVVQRARDLNIT